MEGGNPLPPSVRKAEMTQPGPRRAGALRSATFFSTVADLELFEIVSRAVLRSQELEFRYHKLTGPGHEPVLERVVRLGDGWFPQMRPEPEGRRLIEHLHALATAAGRDPATIGIEARLNLRGASDAALVDLARAWQHIGATHVSINTMGAGLTHVDEHIAAVGRVRQALVTAGLDETSKT